MTEPEWDKPDWENDSESWRAHVPPYIREIWSQFLPTQKGRLMAWAEALEEAERNRVLEAMEEYPSDDD